MENSMEKEPQQERDLIVLIQKMQIQNARMSEVANSIKEKVQCIRKFELTEIEPSRRNSDSFVEALAHEISEQESHNDKLNEIFQHLNSLI